MASHSAMVTVDVGPADSAVSVVGTGVELGARPDAMVPVNVVMSLVLWWWQCANGDAGAVASCASGSRD